VTLTQQPRPFSAEQQPFPTWSTIKRKSQLKIKTCLSAKYAYSWICILLNTHKLISNMLSDNIMVTL